MYQRAPCVFLDGMRRAVVLLVGVVALLAGTTSAASAQVGDEGPGLTMRLTSTTVCVKPDFPAAGRYRINQAVANWNAGQSSVRLYVGDVPGCSEVLVHRYYSKTDDRCGYADYSRLWAGVTQVDGTWQYGGADVYLNDACVLLGCGGKYLTTHELGHALGLGHTRDETSIMSYDYNCKAHHGAIGLSDARALGNLYG